MMCLGLRDSAACGTLIEAGRMLEGVIEAVLDDHPGVHERKLEEYNTNGT